MRSDEVWRYRGRATSPGTLVVDEGVRVARSGSGPIWQGGSDGEGLSAGEGERTTAGGGGGARKGWDGMVSFVRSCSKIQGFL